MKTKTLFAALLIAVSGATVAAGKGDHSHEQKPMHGGLVVEASDLAFELVAKSDVITIHMRDHGKSVSVKGATGKLTLLSGSAKSEATLAPAGDDKLEARGSFQVAAGTKIVATINLNGKKPINVRFAIK